MAADPNSPLALALQSMMDCGWPLALALGLGAIIATLVRNRT